MENYSRRDAIFLISLSNPLEIESNISSFDLIKIQIVCLTIPSNHNRAECVNRSRRERINSHLHFWHHHHHHQTHLHIGTQEERRRRRRGGNDEWLFVAATAVIIMVLPRDFSLSVTVRYNLLTGAQLYLLKEWRKMTRMCELYSIYSSNNRPKVRQPSVMMFNIAVKKAKGNISYVNFMLTTKQKKWRIDLKQAKESNLHLIRFTFSIFWIV